MAANLQVWSPQDRLEIACPSRCHRHSHAHLREAAVRQASQVYRTPVAGLDPVAICESPPAASSPASASKRAHEQGIQQGHASVKARTCFRRKEEGQLAPISAGAIRHAHSLRGRATHQQRGEKMRPRYGVSCTGESSESGALQGVSLPPKTLNGPRKWSLGTAWHLRRR